MKRSLGRGHRDHIGAANAFGITSKHRAWNPRLLDLPYKFFALVHEPGRISDQLKHSSTISLIDFPQVTVHASGHAATNSSPLLQHSESPASSVPVSQSAVTLPIESCQLLAMRFLPTAFPLALLQANTSKGHQITALPRCFPFEQPIILISPKKEK